MLGYHINYRNGSKGRPTFIRTVYPPPDPIEKSGLFKTAKLCLEAVKQNGYSLKFVPEKFKTAKLCLEAVKQNSYAFQFVPEAIKEKVKKLLGGQK